MRALTWNTGCAYGGPYKRTNARAWQQVAAWAPDVALLQEVLRPPPWVPASEVIFTRTTSRTRSVLRCGCPAEPRDRRTSS